MLLFTIQLCCNPAIMLIVNATTNVLSAKDNNPWNKATRLNLPEVICTSDTWKVIPKTKEKYAKSR